MQAHAEVYSILSTDFLPRIISHIVDMVAEEINRLIFSITKFNKNGALQVNSPSVFIYYLHTLYITCILYILPAYSIYYLHTLYITFILYILPAYSIYYLHTLYITCILYILPAYYIYITCILYILPTHSIYFIQTSIFIAQNKNDNDCFAIRLRFYHKVKMSSHFSHSG